MKIAVFANGLNVVGGGERLVLSMVKALDADLIVPDYNEDALKHFDDTVSVKSLKKNLPATDPLAAIAGARFFEEIDFRDDYDFFIAIDTPSMYALKKHKPHFLYCQTPRRELYDMHYIVVNNQKNLFRKLMVNLWCDIYRVFDRSFIRNNIDNIVCNSHNVRNRVYKAYMKNARVAYPPTEIVKYQNKSPENYWLSVNRLHYWKRIELQIEAFRKMPHKKLKIVGKIEKTPYVEKLKAISPENVEFEGEKSENELIDLYSRCEGHITTAIDEDFGLTPIESMASGKPVIAVKEGGYLETVVDGVTGKLVSPEVDDIVGGIGEICADYEKYRVPCLQRAKLFDDSTFKQKISSIVEKIYEQSNI